MADQADVRRIALSLPETGEADDRFAFSVEHRGKQKGFAWVWQERIAPKKPRVPNPEVLAVRVADEGDKQMLIAADAEKFFTEPHYNGFPAVLVRLPAIGVDELEELLIDGWRCQAPRALVEEFEQRQSRDPDRSPIEARFTALAAALAGRDGVTLGSGRRGFGSDAMQVDGRIFAMLSHDHLVLKLPRERVAALVASGDGTPFDAGKGKPLKEWVTLGQGSDEQWQSLAEEALAFVAGRSTGGSRKR
jgi:hypothetical protein